MRCNEILGPRSQRNGPGTTSGKLAQALLLIILVLCGAPSFAFNPNQPQGFGPERSYHEAPDLPDQVDLFSGRLSVVVPIGPFQLIYNNNVWRYSTVIEGGVPKVQAVPDRLQNAGLGWHLGWGELYPPGHWYNGSDQWLYVGDDGSRHTFYDALHRGEVDGDADVYYTRDGSYLRLRKIIGGSTWDLEFPDGATRRFVKGPGSAPYRLTKIWSVFGHSENWDAFITYDADDKLRTVRDRYGRVHRIHLAGGADLVDGHPLAFMNRVITRVEVQGFGGAWASYDFRYRNIDVNLSCKNESGAFGPRVRLPHLVGIDLPDGETAYVMQEGGNPSYVNTCGGSGEADDAPGSLTRLQLPTGGVLRWTYQEYEFPPGETWGAFNTSAGVKTREAIDVDGSVLGSWHYVSRGIGAPPLARPEMRTDVVALPEGDCTRHYFDATYWFSPQQDIGWQYGLPFVSREQNAGRFLSREVFTGHHDSNMLCDNATKVRSEFVQFRRDPIPGASPIPADPGCDSTPNCSRVDEWYNTNRTISATRTVYHDDGNRWTDTQRSGFDGLGNFRTTVRTGNLWSGSANQERRETTINFTRSSGTFPGGGYTHPSPSTPWVLNLFDAIEVREDDGHGERQSREEYVLNDDTGALECVRVLRTGTARDSSDLVTTFERNSLGQVTNVKQYGGDWQPLPGTQVAGCGNLPSQPVYWTRHTYAHGVRKSTRPIHPNGTPASFLTYDVDIDGSSGLVLTSRDTAGTAVHYSYDSTGRLTAITPSLGLAGTTFDFIPPTVAAGAKLAGTSQAGLPGEQIEVLFDGFGRARTERHRMPGGSWSAQTTRRNSRGWPLSITHWGDPTKATRFEDYDPFGRPGKIIPPEGLTKATVYSYLGQRRVVESRKVQTVLNGAQEATVLRIREMDGHGRLRKTTEGDGTSTTYQYDVGNRLTRIFTQAGASAQVRRFEYDNRGFLRSETHPEKGAAGNGVVEYQGYDPAGNAHIKIDGPHNLRYTYDFAGRLTRVDDRNQGHLPLRNFYYDAGLGASEGKLFQAVAHNYLTLPWGTGEVDVRVVQAYQYNGVGGTVDVKDTFVYWPDGSDQFRQRRYQDAAGNLSRQTYPFCVSSPCNSTEAGTAQTQDFSYAYGQLTAVPGWAQSISYHPSGLWSQIQHSNGVVDHQAVSALRPDRVSQIWTTGSAERVNTGTFQYDGSGNVKSMGSDQFAYDTLGRLKSALLSKMGTTEGYAYDIFGNLLSRSSAYGQVAAQYPVNSFTNRLNDATYDGAGNVLSWQGKMFEYNEFDRLTRQAWMQYLYDAHGERALSLVNVGGASRAIYFHLRGMDHELLSTIYTDGKNYTRQLDTVYRGGQLLGAMDQRGNRRHYHLDHLGTPRLITQAGGAVLSRPQVLPYGMDLLGDTVDNRKFTGHERDFSTGTDYMHARHYSAQMGRFLSVDPLRGHFAWPQSLNRNAYGMGNPLRYTDPTGRDPVDPDNNDVPFEDEITVVGDAWNWGHFPFRLLPPGTRDGITDPTTVYGGGDGGQGEAPPAETPDPSGEGDDPEEEEVLEEGCNPAVEDCGPPSNCLFGNSTYTGQATPNTGCQRVVDFCVGMDSIACAKKDQLKEWGVEIPEKVDLPGGIKFDYCKFTKKLCKTIR